MRPRGFTLIELLVVIAVMGAVMALVGPLGTEQVARSERISEIRSFESIIKSQAKQAFLTGSQYQLLLSGKSIVVTKLDDNSSHTVDFKHLFFPNTTLLLSMNGVYSARAVDYVVAGQPRQLSLMSVEHEIR